tara:strand:- start:225 stop:950 length:726 start_codon:yes stop_codon:yes gene_type:complete
MKPLSLRILLPVLAAVMCLAGVAQAASDKAPVVVELFTSQGCSSCPPADAFAGKLAQQDDLIVLSFHVNYWDYIGWKDPFATEETTNRQHAYARALGLRHVYTPQMVIDGNTHEVGSDITAVRKAIKSAEKADPRIPVSATVVDGGKVRVDLPAVDRPVDAVVLMAVFDKSHETDVRRGENRGRTLTNYNVVRHLIRLGDWKGDAKSFEFATDGAGPGIGCVVLVQAAGNGPILGAAKIPG